MMSIRPSQIDLFAVSATPLLATLGKTEVEMAAALIVFVCAKKGDMWQAVSWRDVQDVLKAEKADSHIVRLIETPFLQPNFDGLVERGYAKWEVEGENAKRLVLLPKFIERVRASPYAAQLIRE